MSSNSMEEDDSVISTLFNKNSEDYMETCDNEVDYIVPRLEKLSIKEEPMNLCVPNISKVRNEVIYLDETMTSDSSEKCSISVVGTPNNNLLKEDTITEFVSNKSSLRDDEIPQIVSANIHPQLRSGDDIQKASADGEIQIYPAKKIISNKPEKLKEIRVENILNEEPLDLSPKPKTDRNNEVNFSFTISENKTERVLLNAEQQTKVKYLDPETGEVLPDSGNISSNTFVNDSIGNTLEDVSSDITFDCDSSNLSYSADISSSDDHSLSSGVALDSPPETSGNVASVKREDARKLAGLDLPVLETSRHPSSSTSNTTNATGSSKTNPSDDEHSKKSSAVGKDSPTNSRRKCRKAIRSPRLIARNPSFVKNGEEKRPSPCKRKKPSSETSMETAGKVRRRSISEHNCETGEKTHLAIRSRSLSLKLKNSNSASIAKPSSDISTIPQARKRTISEIQNTSGGKSRRSSDSSDDAGSR